ncbi:MAG: hypothetical protein WCI27_06805 [Candidatus Omnitrophota bacterium]
MGVTYKLKKEIIDLIIDKKKGDPSLSCRKLVVILRDVFQLEVSKSSINAVIKEYNLSNPVGRASTKNFFIPKDKKEQLLAQVTPFLNESAIDKSMLAEDVPVRVLKQEIDTAINIPVYCETTVDINNAGEPLDEETVELATLCPDLLPNRNDSKELVQKQNDSVESKDVFDWTNKKCPLIGNIGITILQGILVDAMRKPVLGDIFSYIGGTEIENQCTLEAAILLLSLYPTSIDDENISKINDFWTFFYLDQQKGQELLTHFFEGKETSATMDIAIETEFNAVFVNNGYFSIKTNTWKNYFFSHNLSVMFDKPSVAENFSMIKAVENAVDRLIHPVKPLVLSFSDSLNESVKHMLIFLNGTAEEKPERICLWGHENTLLWEMNLNFKDKINFIASFDISDDFFQDIEFNEIGVAEKVYNPVLSQHYTIIDGVCHFSCAAGQRATLRALVVKIPEQGKKIFFITNIALEISSAKKIVEDYLEHMFYLEVIKNKNTEKMPDKHMYTISQATQFTYNMLVHKIKAAIEMYINNKFNVTQDVLCAMYNLSGYWQCYEGQNFIRFMLPKEFPYVDQALNLIYNINVDAIEDRNKQKWFFSAEIPENV